jgi:hypothetical protein
LTRDFESSFQTSCVGAGASFLPASVNIPEANCFMPHQVDLRLSEVLPADGSIAKILATVHCLKQIPVEKHLSFRYQRHIQPRGRRLWPSAEYQQWGNHALLSHSFEETK